MINIAEKLKYCKKGTKLYHLMFGEVELNSINKDNDILITVKDNENNKSIFYVEHDGSYHNMYPNGECLLFPSKEQRDWSKFSYLEEGHRVMVSDNRRIWGVYNYYKNNEVYPVGIIPNEINIFSWQYIVPIEDFDFNAEDITVNCAKSII